MPLRCADRGGAFTWRLAPADGLLQPLLRVKDGHGPLTAAPDRESRSETAPPSTGQPRRR